MYYNIRTNVKGTCMAEGQLVRWKSRFQLNNLGNSKEENKDIGGDDTPMTDCEIQRARWKNWGSWKEVRIGESSA